MDTDTQSEPVRSVRPGAIAAGAILLATGAAMLLDRSGALHVHTGQVVAPLVLIALGAGIVLDRGGIVAGRRARSGEERTQVCDRRRRRGSIPGLWMIGVGAWMLASQTHLFGLTPHNSWPLLVILAGVMILIRGIR